MIAQFVDVVGKLVWPILALAVWLFYRRELSDILRTLARRLKDGASIRVAGIEFGAVTVVSPGTGDQAYVTKLALEGGAKLVQDDGSHQRERAAMYENARGLQLVHRLLPPDSDRYLFDILMYVIPHKEASTLAIQYVDYFFGSYWGNQVFRVETRYNAFAIQTSAYGPFLCTALLTFADGTQTKLARYIDFEMGSAVRQKSSSSLKVGRGQDE